MKKVLGSTFDIIRCGLAGRRGGRPAFALLFAALGALFVVSDFLFFGKIFHNILYHIKGMPEQVSVIVAAKLMGLVFLTVSTMLVFSAAIAALSYLYLENDLDLLFSLPLRRSSVILSGTVQTFISASVMVVAIVFPILASYYREKMDSPALALFSFFAFLLFLVPPLAAGTTLTVLLASLLPARRLHQFLTFLGVALLTLLVIFFRVARPESFLNPREARNLGTVIESMALPRESSLPSTWMARAVASAGQGDIERFFLYAGKIALLAALSAALCALTLRVFHGTGFLRSKERAGAAERVSRSRFEKAVSAIFCGRLLPAAPGSILYRDILVFFRSPTEWGQLFILTALVVIYVFNIKYLPRELEDFRVAISLLNFATLGFVVASVSARFAFTSVGGEGGAFFTTRALPVPAGSYVAAKTAFTFLPLAFFSALIFHLSARILGLRGLPFWYFMGATVSGALFMCSLALLMGSLSPKFAEKNPAKMLVSMEGFEYMFFSMAYVGAVVVISARPVFMHYAAILAGSKPERGPWVESFMATLALDMLAPLFMIAAAKKIGRREQA